MAYVISLPYSDKNAMKLPCYTPSLTHYNTYLHISVSTCKTSCMLASCFPFPLLRRVFFYLSRYASFEPFAYTLPLSFLIRFRVAESKVLRLQYSRRFPVHLLMALAFFTVRAMDMALSQRVTLSASQRSN